MVTPLFWISFSLTLLALGGALYSGYSRRRRWHLLLGPAALILLTVAIVFAVLMGQARQFPDHIMRIHRPIAVAAAAAGLGVAATGIRLWRTQRGRRAHLALVWLFTVAAITATATGVWAFTQSTPR